MNRSCVVGDSTPHTHTATLCRSNRKFIARTLLFKCVYMWQSEVPGMSSTTTMIWSEARNHRKWICKFGTNSVPMRNNSLRCSRRISFVQHLIYIHINLNFICSCFMCWTFLQSVPKQPVAGWPASTGCTSVRPDMRLANACIGKQFFFFFSRFSFHFIRLH